MKTNSSSKLDVDFDKYTYACGYVNYYNGNYSVCAKEWTKYLQFDNDNVQSTVSNEKKNLIHKQHPY